MQSCIYEGRVRHHRRAPRDHAFELPLFMLYLDLDELPDIFRRRWLWSARRPAFAWFRREDHFGDASLPLSLAVRDLVEERTGHRPNGPIRLLTQLRMLGLALNPASFFYCFDESGESLEAVVVEVTNTPWGERYCYVLRRRAGSDSDAIRLETAKDFHVSPFMGMDQVYEWAVSPPCEQLQLSIANLEPGGERIFDASLTMERIPIEGRSLARVLLRHPLMTAEIMLGIYWQAFRLWRKRVPFIPHPRTRETALEINP